MIPRSFYTYLELLTLLMKDYHRACAVAIFAPQPGAKAMVYGDSGGGDGVEAYKNTTVSRRDTVREPLSASHLDLLALACLIILTGIVHQGPVNERDDEGQVGGDGVRQPVGATQRGGPLSASHLNLFVLAC